MQTYVVENVTGADIVVPSTATTITLRVLGVRPAVTVRSAVIPVSPWVLKLAADRPTSSFKLVALVNPVPARTTDVVEPAAAVFGVMEVTTGVATVPAGGAGIVLARPASAADCATRLSSACCPAGLR